MSQTVQKANPIEVLENVLSKIKRGKVGPTFNESKNPGCYYTYPSGHNCLVGAMFNEAQLKDIKSRQKNHIDIYHLTQEIGQDNIEHVTGLTVRELSSLQRFHDGISACCNRENKRAYQKDMNQFLARTVKSILKTGHDWSGLTFPSVLRELEKTTKKCQKELYEDWRKLKLGN